MNEQQDPPSAHATAPIIGNCLKCQGMVRVPARTSANAEVKCPHCGETFLLARVLEQVVPELEVVTPGESEATSSVTSRPDSESAPSLEKFVVPSQLANGAKRRRRRRGPGGSTNNGASDAGGAESLEGSHELEAVSDVIEGPRIDTESTHQSESSRSGGRDSSRDARREGSRQRSRSRRRTGTEANPMMELIKVVLGALLAVPIAYLLVLWGFQQDPLNIGPTIGRTAPMLVPAAFRENAGEDTGDNDTESTGPDQPPVLEYDPERDGGLPIPVIDPDKIGRQGQ